MLSSLALLLLAVGLLLRQDHAILVRDGPHRGEHDPTAQCNDAIHLWMQPGGQRGMDKAFVIDCRGSRAEPPFNGSEPRKLRLPVRSLAIQIKMRAQPKVKSLVDKFECMCGCLTAGTVEALWDHGRVVSHMPLDRPRATRRSVRAIRMTLRLTRLLGHGCDLCGPRTISPQPPHTAPSYPRLARCRPLPLPPLQTHAWLI